MAPTKTQDEKRLSEEETVGETAKAEMCKESMVHLGIVSSSRALGIVQESGRGATEGSAVSFRSIGVASFWRGCVGGCVLGGSWRLPWAPVRVLLWDPNSNDILHLCPFPLSHVHTRGHLMGSPKHLVCKNYGLCFADKGTETGRNEGTCPRKHTGSKKPH